MKAGNHDYIDALQSARQEYLAGKYVATRRWAQKAANLIPDSEEPWLWLAAVAQPYASLNYLKKALEINPHSQRARQGMHWAVQRLRKSPSYSSTASQITLIAPEYHWQASVPSLEATRMHWGVFASLLVLGLMVWVFFAAPPLNLSSWLNRNQSLLGAQLILDKISLTPTSSSTPSSTPTLTFTPTSTPTDTPTPTPPPTETPKPTKKRKPTKTPTSESISNPTRSFSDMPEGVSQKDRWIDIDLSEQRTYAYEGKKLVKSFTVSTGTWQYPTVTGSFQIYVKYTYADMSGPGYYLPDVPYVMYFYKSYGIHGTYWHNNFGTPMSHGCVNLTIEDAGWLFNWSSIGTVVNVHY